MSKRTHAAVSTLLAATAFVSVLAGCSNQPRLTQPDLETSAAPSAVEPAPSLAANGEQFPLVVGNRWRYGGRIVEEAVLNSGPTFRSFRRYRMHNALICDERLGARSYVVGRERTLFEGGVDYTQWIRYRQDRSGLFEADYDLGAPPDCEDPARAGAAADPTSLELANGRHAFEDAALEAAYERTRAELLARLEVARRLAGGAGATGVTRDRHIAPEGVEFGELTRLAYPLHVGQRWLIRRDPRFASHVVAHESLTLPAGRHAGWKVRITSELFGPRDRVLFWVSRLGFLQYDFRLIGDLVDADGTVIGTLTIHEHRELFDFALHGPGRSGDTHPSPEPAAPAVE